MVLAGRAQRSDTGSGSVWVACGLGVLAAVAGAFTAAGALAATHARAVTAADLAALRGADVLQHFGTSDEACAAAATLAALNGAALVSCAAAGMDVRVTVVAGGGAQRVRATARAGPAEESTPRWPR